MSWQARHLSKKAFREVAIMPGRPMKHISEVCFNPGIFPEKESGTVSVEGPYPVHRWYATVRLDEKGYVKDVK